MSKYLDPTGLQYVWQKMKQYVGSAVPKKTSELTNDSGFSSVSVSQVVSSGTKIATVSVDGSGTDIYAPFGGGTVMDVEVNGTSVVDGDGVAAVTVPTNVSDLNNDSGFITGYTETDPVFVASDAYGISSTDISNWNGKSDFSGDYNDLDNLPTLFSGDYNDLENLPSLFSGNYNDLSNLPTLFSGSYNDLTDKPTIPGDTKVDQQNKDPSGYTYWRPLLMGYSSGSSEGFTPSGSTNVAYTFKTLSAQPSSGTIRAGAVDFFKGNYEAKVEADTLTGDRTAKLQDKSGTLALTSDIPSVPSKLSDLTNDMDVSDFPNDAGYLTSAHEVPSGGSSGQVLAKHSNNDYDVEWVNQSGGGGAVNDVTVDGTSVVSSGVAAIDLTGKSDTGHTHVVTDVTDFPSLATVATSGDYGDLDNLPTLFSGDYNDLSNLPTLFSGDYGDLSNTPTIPSNVSDLYNDAGYITGVTSDDTPTVDTIAEFDSSAHMNSTDMSSADVTSFVNSLNVNGGNPIVIKDYSVTTATNSSVSPFGAYLSYTFVDPPTGYSVLSTELMGTGSTNPAISRAYNDLGAFIYSKSAGTFTLRVVFIKNS